MDVLRIRRREISDEQISQIIVSFEQFKAERDEALLEDNGIFVRTPAFESLAQHRSSRTNTILLGRKGDGKTAILKRLQIETNRSLGGTKSEYFTWINMEEAYFSELVSKFQIITSAIKINNPAIPANHISAQLWMKFIKLTSLQTFVRFCEENRDLQIRIENKYNIKIDNLKTLVADQLGIQENYFRQSDIGPNFVSFLKKIQGMLFQADGHLAGQIDSYERRTFSTHDTLRDISPELEEWARVIDGSGHLFTIALDRFDDFVDNLISDDLQENHSIRRNFLQGLVPTLSKLDTERSFNWLRIVASLPEDLVLDIKLREIASHRRLHFIEIDWSRNDLTSLLDGRVSSVIPGIIFEDIFAYQVPNLNSLVLTKESSSNYLIRHTTRRPREVMAHAAQLFHFIRKHKRVPYPKEFGQIIHASNRNIVEDQIFPEWIGVLPNLRSFFSGISRRTPPTVFGLSDFEQWDQSLNSIGTHRYGGATASSETRSLTALASLFRVGAIGFRVRRSSRKDGYIRQGENDFVRYIFSFSSEKDPISDIVDFLLRPNLAELVETSEGKSHRGTLLGQDKGAYEITLCFSPMFFEISGAEHIFPFLVGECLAEENN